MRESELGRSRRAHPTSELVEVDGLSLRVSIEGRGRPLLLFNGIGAALELLAPFRRALLETQTIAIDLPGTGSSATTTFPRSLRGLAGLADALLDVLGYDRVDVLGVSWGGALAQEFTLRYPWRVRRLVLVATTAGWVSVPGSPAALRVLATPRRYYSPTYFAEIAPTLYGGAVRANPRLLEDQGHLRFIRPPSVRGYVWQLAALVGWTSMFRLHRIASPTLVLAADDDPIVPLVNAELIVARLRDGRLSVVRQGGHLFLITHAETIGPEVEAFLAGGA
ncbi:MAG TPA: poly(3-hydroxyalkanoate) depolymerase [Polyangiaceae bacterium]|nr:poly(3-hydroxyalkanoate) depolymerase [Polyangiaceae bacterium]